MGDLGFGKKDSAFHIEARLDPQGACVRSLVLNKFRKADINGALVKEADGEPATLDLIPLDETTKAGSFCFTTIRVMDRVNTRWTPWARSPGMLLSGRKASQFKKSPGRMAPAELG